MSESSEEVSLAQKQKHLKREQTSPTAHTPTPVASMDAPARLDVSSPPELTSRQLKRRKEAEGKLANIAKRWQVDMDWLRTRFGNDILQTTHFTMALQRWIDAHPTMSAQTAFDHIKRRRDLRRSGALSGPGLVKSTLWQAVDLRLDEEEDASSVSATARTVLQRQKLLDSRLENVAGRWKVDMNWLTTKFDREILQTQHFNKTLYKWVEAHPTISAQTALEHFERRRELRRSGSWE